MADRYWVGGTGTWNTTSTTNWSETSGGAGGASVPTAADNVIFDQAGTYTVTMTGALTCLDFTVSAGNVTINDTTVRPTLTISGNLSLIATTVWAFTQYSASVIVFNATTAKTIGINGIQIGQVNFNGAGGTWTLTSAAVFERFTLTNGTFSTSTSNYSVTFADVGSACIIAANSNAKTLSLNGSTIPNIQSFTNNSTGNFTFNAGTSTINVAGTGGASTTFYSTQSLTFYNFSSTDGFNTGLVFSGADSSVVFTFNDLTFTGGSYINTDRPLVIPANASTTNMVINGTLTMRGGAMAPGARVILRGQDFNSGSSVQARISAAAVSLVDVDFYCVNNTGVSAWTGARLGDMGNNTNITTTTPRTVYYSAATLGQYASGNPWANTSGGTAVANNYPLVQDVAVIDNSSGNGTLTLGSVFAATINASSRTTSMNIAPAGAVFFKDFLLAENVRQAGITTIYFYGTGNSTFTTSNANLSLGIVVSKANANVTFTGNVTSNQNFTLTSGTLNLNSANLTCLAIFGSSSVVRSINFGTTGKITTKRWDFGNLTNFSLSGSRTVIINATSSSDFGGISHGSGHTNGTEVNAIDLYLVSGNYSFSSYGIKVRDIDFSGYSGTYSIPGFVDAENYFYGNITLSSTMTIGSAPYIYIAAVSGTNYITSNGKILTPVSFGARGGSATWILLDNAQFNPVNHANGTIDLNGKTLTTTGYTTLDGTKNLTFNGGTLSSSGSFNNDKPGGFTVTQGTGTGKITFTGSGSKSFIGAGNNYSGIILSQGGAGTLTVTGSNIFDDIVNDRGASGNTTISFTSGTMQTLSNFTAKGAGGRYLTIQSTSAGSRATLSKSSGTVTASYLRIKDINANGGASWIATQSNDLGNNLGWSFRFPNFLAFF